ncbi:hypothetical protein PAT3040_06494 [Paenibacillus agaridevorans]|uniref:Uncharacterized protein n=1 Tax=Paenibacillus agaridevorans TaxID=171404 RepID=A0A2R5F0Z0_9BACL|nr:hypothetical protein [Paenibacillus agaridevorans]GBG11659.1 hypothetical protein PAT3040_06494 [Paenibacillus agaridevorans]
MLQHYNDRLAELKKQQRQKSNWTASREQLKVSLANAKEDLGRLEAWLQEEQRDVDRLKKLSLGGLFYSLIGKKKEKLSEEEAELLQAKLQYDEASDTVSDLEKELADIEANLAPVRYVESDIEAAMREKEKHIYDAHPALASELKLWSDEEAETEADAKELREAVNAGRSVISSLDRASERLQSARNWGTADMLGGGLLTTMAKHGHIDDARSAIHSAQSSLRRFEKELKDVQRDVGITIDIGSMMTFADYFFDGFLMDWVVQGRIKDAAESVREKRALIRRIVAELETELGAKDRKLAELRRRQSSLIEQA